MPAPRRPIRDRPPRWVYAPRLRWDLIGPLPADEVTARLLAARRFGGGLDERGRLRLLWQARLLPVGPELRGDVNGRTGGSVITVEARLSTPVAMATTLWVAGLFAAAIALAGLMAFGAVLLLAAGVLGALLVGFAFQLNARGCRLELLRLAEAALVNRRPASRH